MVLDYNLEIRKRSSGGATPQLVFVGFHVLEEDPLWKPTTNEELENYGDIADKENIAKRYVDMVRKRKGIIKDREMVEGEKDKSRKQ